MEVRVGQRLVPIERLNGRKLDVGGQIVSRLMSHLTEVMASLAEFRRDYSAHNSSRVRRGQTVPARPLTAEERVELDDTGRLPESVPLDPLWRRLGYVEGDFDGRPYIDHPDEPSENELIMVGFTRVFALAREDVVRLIGLAAAPREKLREARKRNRIDEFLLESGEDLIDDLDDEEQFVELIAACLDVLRRLFRGGAVGKLRQAWQGEGETPDSPPTSPEDATSSSEPTEAGYIRDEVQVATVEEKTEVSSSTPSTG